MQARHPALFSRLSLEKQSAAEKVGGLFSLVLMKPRARHAAKT
jgi:hypothetical protein